MSCGQCGQPKNVPAHTAHSPDDEAALFSVIKWTCFRLSRYGRNGQSGSLFGDQVDLFSLDKNSNGQSRPIIRLCPKIQMHLVRLLS